MPHFTRINEIKGELLHSGGVFISRLDSPVHIRTRSRNERPLHGEGDTAIPYKIVLGGRVSVSERYSIGGTMLNLVKIRGEPRNPGRPELFLGLA